MSEREPRQWVAVRRAGGRALVIEANVVERAPESQLPVALLRDGQVVYQLPADVKEAVGFPSQRGAEDQARAWREAATGATLSLQESAAPSRRGRGDGSGRVIPLEGIRISIKE